MKKFLVLASVLLAVVMIFAACGGKETPAVTEDSTNAATDPATDAPATDAPTEEPTEAPSEAPTEPAETPTEAPTQDSETPTDEPKETEKPTEAPTEAPTEPPVDPSAPLHTVEPAFLANYANQTGNLTCNQHLASSEVKTENGRTFIHLVSGGNDPYIAFIDGGMDLQVGRYMAISYRTNSTRPAHFFMGSDKTGWTGNGDMFGVDWNEDSQWNLMVIDLDSQSGYTAMQDYVLNYARLDFFHDGAASDADYFDIEYIAFFSSVEAAANYDFEMHKAPMWNESGVITHQSFDQLYLGTGVADNNTETNIFFTPGQSATWDFIADLTAVEGADVITYWGWVGVKGELGQFGYQVNGGSIVYNPDWTHATEQPVIDAAVGGGADTGSRFKIAISVAALEGENTIRVIYKTADGVEACLNEFTVIMPAAMGDTTMNVTVNAAGNFAADAAVDAQVDLTNSNLADIFTTVTHAAGDKGVAINAEGGAYYKSQGFFEAFVKMDGTYAYNIKAISAAKKQMASFFVRGAQSVKPVDTTGITNVLNNYYETDGKDAGHAGAGIQVWPHTRLFLGIKYYDENALTKIGTAYWLIEVDAKNTDIQIIDAENVIYITVNDELIATIELVGSGKSYDGLLVTDNATFCEKAIVTLHCDLKPGTVEEYGFAPDENGQIVIENPLIVDTPMSDIGIANRTGTLSFSELSVKPLSEVTIPSAKPEEPAEPEYYENLNVTQDQWVVSGHCPQIVGKEGHSNSAMVAAGGVESGALLHQGAIGIGNIDLSKYSKAIVYYGVDNSDTTWGHWNANANNRIMLVSADTNMTNSPAEETVIAGATYEPCGWAVVAFEIDLTGIDYNGPVYVTYDTLPGTFMLFYSIEFIGAEKTEEPAAPAINWGDAGKFSVCADNVSYVIGDVKTDWCGAEGHKYMATVNNTIVIDGYDFISFRGWANPNVGGIEIDSFGYQIGNNEPVFDASFAIDEPTLNQALNSAAARRYEGIKIPVADLAAGSYSIKLLVKDTNGVVYNMNGSWNGDITFVKN